MNPTHPLNAAPPSVSAGADDIKERVRGYVRDNFLMGAAELELADDTSFLDTGILDSIGFIEVIAFLEETCDIEVLDEEMVPENLDSLRRIETYVAGKRGR